MIILISFCFCLSIVHLKVDSTYCILGVISQDKEVSFVNGHRVSYRLDLGKDLGMLDILIYESGSSKPR